MVTYIPSFQPAPIRNGIVFLVGAIGMYILLITHCIITCMDDAKEKREIRRQNSGIKQELTRSWPILLYLKNCNPLTRDGVTGPTRQQRLIWYAKINTIFMMIFNAINLTMGTILMLKTNWDPTIYPNHSYNSISWIFKILVLSYDLGKFTLYFIFLIRIQIAFYGSSYQYPKKLIRFVRFLLCVFIMVMFIGDIFFSHIEWELISTNNTRDNLIWFPQGYVANDFLLFQLIFDPFITILTLYLFIKPLTELVVLMRRSSMTQSTSTGIINELIKTRNLMVKLTYLTIIALITSAILLILIVGLNAFAEFTSFDLIINTLCILLMNQRYSNLYNKICGKCHNKMVKWCCGVGVLFGNKRKETEDKQIVEEHSEIEMVKHDDEEEQTETNNINIHDAIN